MALDDFDRGVKYGYNSALRVLREFDKKIFDLTINDDTYNIGISSLYNIQKDFLHEIYGAIKKDKEEILDENDF